KDFLRWQAARRGNDDAITIQPRTQIEEWSEHLAVSSRFPVVQIAAHKRVTHDQPIFSQYGFDLAEEFDSQQMRGNVVDVKGIQHDDVIFTTFAGSTPY